MVDEARAGLRVFLDRADPEEAVAEVDLLLVGVAVSGGGDVEDVRAFETGVECGVVEGVAVRLFVPLPFLAELESRVRADEVRAEPGVLVVVDVVGCAAVIGTTEDRVRFPR